MNSRSRVRVWNPALARPIRLSDFARAHLRFPRRGPSSASGRSDRKAEAPYGSFSSWTVFEKRSEGQPRHLVRFRWSTKECLDTKASWISWLLSRVGIGAHRSGAG